MTAAGAAELVGDYVKAMLSSERLMANMSPWAAEMTEGHIRQALSNGQETPAIHSPQPVDARMLREALYIAQDAAVRRLWQQHRIVYDLDPDVWAELGETDDDDVIPAGLFAKLAHPDPFVAFPAPMRFVIDDACEMRVGGFFVIGRSDGFMVSTTSPQTAGRVMLLIGASVLYRDTGKPVMVSEGIPDMIWNRVTLNTNNADMTVGEMLAGIRERFDRYHTAGAYDDTVPVMVRRAVSALIYLCAANADLRPLPARPPGKANKRLNKALKPPKVIQVGYQVGAALRAHRRSQAVAAAQPGKRSVRAHVRRAHFHTYRVGAGRTDTIVRWLHPMLIKAGGPPATLSTVIAVDKVKR